MPESGESKLDVGSTTNPGRGKFQPTVGAALKVTRLSLLKRTLIRLAGADVSTIQSCSPHVPGWYARLGLGLLIPCSFGVFTGGFTAHTLGIGSFSLALIFGLFWGLCILIIDVMIMSQLRKYSDSAGSKRKWRSRVLAVGRLLMAGLVGYVVSETFVLAIFRHRITSKIESGRKIEQTSMDELHGTAKAAKLAERRARVGERPLPPREPERQQPTKNPAAAFTGPERVRLAREKVQKAGLELIEAQAQRNKLSSKKSAFDDAAKAELTPGESTGAAFPGEVYKENVRNAKKTAREIEAADSEIDAKQKALEVVNKELTRTEEESKSEHQGIENLRKQEEERRKLEADAAEAHYSFERANFDAAMLRYKVELAEYSKKEANWEKERATMWKEHEERENELRNEPRGDLLFQIEALDKLIDEHPILRPCYWLILLVIFTIDTAPVLIKALKLEDQYDRRIYVSEESACRRMMKELDEI